MLAVHVGRSWLCWTQRIEKDELRKELPSLKAGIKGFREPTNPETF